MAQQQQNLAEKVINYADKWFFIILLAAPVPILSFVGFWWASYLLRLPEKQMITLAFTGLAMGVITSIVLYLRGKFRFPSPGNRYAAIVFVFYNLCFFGFFMGIPIFHPILGALAGFYCGRKAFYLGEPISHPDSIQQQVPLFASMIMLLVCISSAFIALVDPYTAINLELMFRLKFHVTRLMFWVLSVFGSLLLVFVQYFITLAGVQLGLKLGTNYLKP
jgi:hypothetical protein